MIRDLIERGVGEYQQHILNSQLLNSGVECGPPYSKSRGEVGPPNTI